MRIRKPIFVILVVVITSLVAVVIAAKWWITSSKNLACIHQLRNYNTAVASCGIDASCYEAWKDPEKAKQLVSKLFQERVPECPLGGTYTLVYNRGINRWLPILVCSMEQSHGHVDTRILDEERQIAERARMGSAVKNVQAIATSVASSIERLKSKYPHLGQFSISECLRKTPPQQDMEPGSPGNPELYSISYRNGIIANTPQPEAEQGRGKKRLAEDTFDPATGIKLDMHFFKGETRGSDVRHPHKIGTLSVHLYVSGPAAEAISREIQNVLRRLQDDYRCDLPDIPP